MLANRRRTLAGMLLTPLAGACAATAPPIDGTWVDTGDSNFNNPGNWSGKVVPTGVATIAVTTRQYPPITFSSDTQLAEIRLSGSLGLSIASGRQVTANLQILDGGVAEVNGTLAGAVVVRGELASLCGVGGTIVGNVTCERGAVAPGPLFGQGTGTLTINGGYTQLDVLSISVDNGIVSRLAVTNDKGGSGRATLGPRTTLVFQPFGTSPPPRGRWPVLTTTSGLTGQFTNVFQLKLDYSDGRNAFVIV